MKRIPYVTNLCYKFVECLRYENRHRGQVDFMRLPVKKQKKEKDHSARGDLITTTNYTCANLILSADAAILNSNSIVTINPSLDLAGIQLHSYQFALNFDIKDISSRHIKSNKKGVREKRIDNEKTCEIA